MEKDYYIGLRVPKTVIDALDKQAKKMKMKRSKMVRQFIYEGLYDGNAYSRIHKHKEPKDVN